jgi:O-antigen/teichoic acid export membrane protein
MSGENIRMWLQLRSIRALIEPSDVIRRLGEGATWSLASAAFSRGIALILSIWIARLIGKEEFGALGVIQGTIAMFGALSGFGLGLTATKFVAEFRHSNIRRVGEIMSLLSTASLATGAIGCAILYFSAPWLAEKMLATPQLSGTLATSSILMFLGAVTGVQNGVLLGFQKFKAIAMLNVAIGAATVPCTIIFIRLLGGLNGFVWSTIVLQLITAWAGQRIITSIKKSHAITFTMHTTASEWRIIFKYSLPALLTSMLVVIVNWGCFAMLVNQPRGYAEMGTYNAIQQWRVLLLFVPGILVQVALPPLAERLNNAPSAEAARLVGKVFYVVGCATAPIFILLCVTSGYILNTYGSSFENEKLSFILLQCAGLLQALQSPLVKFLESTDRMWLNLALNVGWGATVVVLTWWLMIYGALGFCIAQVLAFFIYGVALLTCVRMSIANHGTHRRPAISTAT